MDSNRIPSRQQGFSLIELVIGMAIFLLVLLAVYQLFDTGSATYRSGQRKVDVQQNARVALDEVVRQLRMAGYFPENYNTDTTDNLANPRALHVAASTGLAVYGDLDGSCTTDPCAPPNSSNVFLYCLETDKGARKVYIRRVKGPTGDANSYRCVANPGPGVTSDILAELADLTYARNSDAIIDGTAWLTFTYYGVDINNNPVLLTPAPLDGEGLGAVPAFACAPACVRSNVRTVVITLVLREEIAHQDPQIYSLTSSIRLRNLN
jgi:prepilin-type N-terminal cleavage/methylation domain-containing protein